MLRSGAICWISSNIIKDLVHYYLQFVYFFVGFFNLNLDENACVPIKL